MDPKPGATHAAEPAATHAAEPAATDAAEPGAINAAEPAATNAAEPAATDTVGGEGGATDTVGGEGGDAAGAPRQRHTDPDVGSVRLSVRCVLDNAYQVLPLPGDADMATLLSFLGKLRQHCQSELECRGSRIAVPRGREESLFERIEVDLGFLRKLERTKRFRLSGQMEFVQDNEGESRAALSVIVALLRQFRAALHLVGVEDADDWSFFSFCLWAESNTPAQDYHCDCATNARDQSKYFTFLLPVSESAERTEFCIGNGRVSFPGIAMFDGNVRHRGPATGDTPRLVLSLVASKGGQDRNHVSAVPFRRGKKDWAK